LLLLVTYLSFLYESYSIALISILMLILPIVSLLGGLHAKNNISVSLSTSKAAIVKNEQFVMEIYFSNDSVLPIPRIDLRLTSTSQFTGEVKMEAYSLSVDGKCVTKAVCKMNAKYCGNIEFGIMYMIIYDFLGLWKIKIPASRSINVSILPNTVEVINNMLKGSTEVFLEEDIYSTRRSGDDPSEIFRIREYAEGDKLNRMHWKLSAKTGTLIIKDFGLPLDSSVVILTELYYMDQDTERMIDAQLETMFSLSMQFMALRQIHFVAWYDVYTEDLVRVRIVDEDDVYDAITRIFTALAYREIFQGIVTYQERYRTEQYSNLFYITTRLAVDEIHQIREFAKQAHCHVAYVTDKEALATNYTEGFKDAQISCSMIRPEYLYDDIRERIMEAS